MPKKLTPRERLQGEQVRAVARELGTFTERDLVEECLRRGIYRQDDLDKAARRELEKQARLAMHEGGIELAD